MGRARKGSALFTGLLLKSKANPKRIWGRDRSVSRGWIGVFVLLVQFGNEAFPRPFKNNVRFGSRKNKFLFSISCEFYGIRVIKMCK